MITFVTGNPGKAEEIGKQINVGLANKALDLPEIQSLDIKEIIETKAREAFEQIGSPVLVDDASISIDDLGGLPGPLVKWFLNAIGNEGICRFADQSASRSASAIVALGYFDGKEFTSFISEVRGTIAQHQSGKTGYGWDAVFIQEGYSVTRADLSFEEYDKASIRRPALNQLKEFLKQTG